MPYAAVLSPRTSLRVRSTEDEDSPKGYRSPKPATPSGVAGRKALFAGKGGQFWFFRQTEKIFSASPLQDGCAREHKKHRRLRKTAVCSVAYESVLALTCSFCFLLAFHAGLLIMLTLASLCQNTCASTLTFEPLQSAFQGFILADAYLGHCYPSPRSSCREPHSDPQQPCTYYNSYLSSRQPSILNFMPSSR